jgi:hypothetical protein
MDSVADPQDKVDFSWSPPQWEDDASAPPVRPWLRIWYSCCKVYARAYKTPDGRAYEGACPRCGGRVRARVGAGGTSRRSFWAE